MPRPTKTLLITAAGLLCAAGAHAQQAPVPPPPGLNDPGVAPAAPATAPAPASSGLRGSVPKLPDMDVGGHGRDGLGQPPPTMDIRSVGKDKVEEYRMNGRLYMIHVIPAHGVPQTYMVNPQGELMRRAGQPPVKPVYYTLYKWGGPEKGKDQDSDNK